MYMSLKRTHWRRVPVIPLRPCSSNWAMGGWAVYSCSPSTAVGVMRWSSDHPVSPSSVLLCATYGGGRPPYCPHTGIFISRMHKTGIATRHRRVLQQPVTSCSSPFFTRDSCYVTRGLMVSVSRTKNRRMLTRLKSPRVQVNGVLTALLSRSLP